MPLDRTPTDRAGLKRVVAIVRDSMRWLCPPATTAAARAAHGVKAAHLMDTLLRELLAAGLIDRPDDPLARRVLALEAFLRGEADALRAWAETPGCDDEQPDPEPAPIRRKAGRR